MTTTGAKFGILLPHFGSGASRERVVGGAKRAEELGFDSVWLRDHVVFRPHEHEEQNNTHVDPFVCASAIASATEHITLGFGTLIPHRHPIHTALALGSLEFIAGPGRIIAGFGLGGFAAEFEAIGMGHADRRELLPEQVEIMRRLWTGEKVDHQGTYYTFEDVNIAPVPQEPVPIWYGGGSKAAVRRSVEYCDGWMPGRIPRRNFAELRERLVRMSDEAGRALPTTAAIPYISPGRTVEEGASFLNLPELFNTTAKLYGGPPSGAYTKVSELDGAAIVGPPDTIAEEVDRYLVSGVDHFVFDMRVRFPDFEEMLELIGTQVLPLLHGSDSAAASA